MEELELHPFQHASLSVFVDGNLPVVCQLPSPAITLCGRPGTISFLHVPFQSFNPCLDPDEAVSERNPEGMTSLDQC